MTVDPRSVIAFGPPQPHVAPHNFTDSLSSFSAAFGYVAPYVSWKRSTADSAASRFSAFMISCCAVLAFDPSCATTPWR
jgi:hypothetical protein